ncbi:DUF1661 domain-containing protein [Porphyromonas gingivalis]|uniref:DUF1661 domain-containing protein n=1 Tax=Porphyromonas gingivalis TaxID=837 RepID=UPI0018E06EBA|nr:DUF1661 domain-containing protein [Porphyromonas gingivalis]
MVREIKNSRATTKNFLFRFFRKHAPQSEHFRFVFYTPPSPLFYFRDLCTAIGVYFVC